LKNFFNNVEVWTGNIGNIANSQEKKCSSNYNNIFALAAKNGNSIEEVKNRILFPEIPEILLTIKILQETLNVSRKTKINIPVSIRNQEANPLCFDDIYMINLSYHILDLNGNIVVYDGIRTPLNGIIDGEEILNLVLEIEIPETLISGSYLLRAAIVVEGHCWLDNIQTDGENEMCLIVQ